MWVLGAILLVLAVIVGRVAYIYIIAGPERPWDPNSEK